MCGGDLASTKCWLLFQLSRLSSKSHLCGILSTHSNFHLTHLVDQTSSSSAPIMFQVGEGQGPDYFVMFILSTIVMSHGRFNLQVVGLYPPSLLWNMDENIKLSQKHVVMSCLKVKKKKKNTAAFQFLRFLMIISYLLCAFEVVFLTNTLHSLLATLPSKAVVGPNWGFGSLFSSEDAMEECPVSLLNLMQHEKCS